MLYKANITCGALRLRESRLLASLLVENVDAARWKQALYTDNILQLRSAASIKKISGIIRSRLTALDASLLELILSGDRELATQAVLAGAIKESRLLGDFMDLAIRERWTTFDRQIDNRIWSDYLESCRWRDPDMPEWSESTRQRLRSTVYSLLVEGGYLSNSRNLQLQRVCVHPELRPVLESASESYVLRCLAVTS